MNARTVDALGDRVKVNFVYNVVGMGLPMAIALVTVPAYLSSLGTARYGVLAIVWLLLGYFGFLDFGLSRASAVALSRLSGASRSERAAVLGTSLYLNLSIGASGGIALYLLGSIWPGLFCRNCGELGMEMHAALPWIAGMVPLALVAGVSVGAMESRERFLAVNVLELTGTVLGQVLPLICAIMIAPTLPVVIASAFSARALSLALMLIFVAHFEGVATFRRFDRDRVKELFSFGAWVSVTNVISPLLMGVDQLLIGYALGPSAVAHYSVPMNLVSRSLVIPWALVRTLFPRLSRATPHSAVELGESTLVSFGYAFGALCAPGIVLGGPFMALWMGSEFASYATPVVQLLLLAGWINGLGFIPYVLLQSQGRPDLVAKLHVAELLPFIALLAVLLYRWGLQGAAVAWGARIVMDVALLLYAARFRIQTLVRLLPAAVLLLGAYVATVTLHTTPIWSIAMAVCLFAAYALCGMLFDKQLRTIPVLLRNRLT